MELLEKTREPIHVVAIPTMETGKFPIKNQTIRLICGKYTSHGTTTYTYNIQSVREELREIIEGLGLDATKDIHIISEDHRGHIRHKDKYDIFVRQDDHAWYELSLLIKKEPNYQAIADILEKNDWEFQENKNDGEHNLFKRYFKISFKKIYKMEPHLSFYVTPGSHKFKYNLVEITSESALIELCIHKMYTYSNDSDFMIHWQVIGLVEDSTS